VIVMEDWERDQIRSANDHLRDTLAEVQGEFDSEMVQVGEINQQLAQLKIRATSPNELARVTVNSSGLVIDVAIAEDAYRRSTPSQLAEDLNAAIRGAVEAASQERARIVAPITSIVAEMPDLDEIVPGAPSMRNLEARLSDEQRPPPGRSD
jgi:DNA-binding protein YbaB